MSRRPGLVLGASGQVARALARCGSVGGYPMLCRGRPEGNITEPLQLRALLSAINPIAVVNAAAYTAVDRAETETAAAFAANAEGPETLARLCRDDDIPLVHLSTDYVFDGSSRRPYRETDAIAPINVYGASKAAGEAAIRLTWPRHVILRTAWVYSLDGTNFVTTMLRLANERDELGIVADQRGTPTWAGDLARAITDLLPRMITDKGAFPWGTYHLTSRGETTWFGFASQVFQLAEKFGQRCPQLRPITTSDYPTPARRPAYSVLDNRTIKQEMGLELPEWQTSLALCLTNLRKQEPTREDFRQE